MSVVTRVFILQLNHIGLQMGILIHPTIHYGNLPHSLDSWTFHYVDQSLHGYEETRARQRRRGRRK